MSDSLTIPKLKHIPLLEGTTNALEWFRSMTQTLKAEGLSGDLPLILPYASQSTHNTTHHLNPHPLYDNPMLSPRPMALPNTLCHHVTSHHELTTLAPTLTHLPDLDS
ncbi:hypothetical protein BYT27DRAFT_7260783 [Phlegmacium glaucopus]|nr:hypothetical protein BYT27DRAFT_7260783 [Phlegmacium glaucopus]